MLAAAAGQSEAGIASARASLDLAQANEARIHSLFAEEYVSRQELDQAVQAKKAARAIMPSASPAHRTTATAPTRLLVIRSPVSGVSWDRQIDVGQTVAASFQTPVLFKIAQDPGRCRSTPACRGRHRRHQRSGSRSASNVDAFPNRQFWAASKSRCA